MNRVQLRGQRRVGIVRIISTGGAIAGTIFGNSVVGVLYGWCYWRRSLVAARISRWMSCFTFLIGTHPVRAEALGLYSEGSSSSAVDDRARCSPSSAS